MGRPWRRQGSGTGQVTRSWQEGGAGGWDLVGRASGRQQTAGCQTESSGLQHSRVREAPDPQSEAQILLDTFSVSIKTHKKKYLSYCECRPHYDRELRSTVLNGLSSIVLSAAIEQVMLERPSSQPSNVRGDAVYRMLTGCATACRARFGSSEVYLSRGSSYLVTEISSRSVTVFSLSSDRSADDSAVPWGEGGCYGYRGRRSGRPWSRTWRRRPQRTGRMPCPRRVGRRQRQRRRPAGTTLRHPQTALSPPRPPTGSAWLHTRKACRRPARAPPCVPCGPQRRLVAVAAAQPPPLVAAVAVG